MAVGKCDALRSEGVDIRGVDPTARVIGFHITVANIISINNNDVRTFFPGRSTPSDVGTIEGCASGWRGVSEFTWAVVFGSRLNTGILPLAGTEISFAFEPIGARCECIYREGDAGLPSSQL